MGFFHSYWGLSALDFKSFLRFMIIFRQERNRRNASHARTRTHSHLMQQEKWRVRVQERGRGAP